MADLGHGLRVPLAYARRRRGGPRALERHHAGRRDVVDERFSDALRRCLAPAGDEVNSAGALNLLLLNRPLRDGMLGRDRIR